MHDRIDFKKLNKKEFEEMTFYEFDYVYCVLRDSKTGKYIAYENRQPILDAKCDSYEEAMRNYIIPLAQKHIRKKCYVCENVRVNLNCFKPSKIKKDGFYYKGLFKASNDKKEVLKLHDLIDKWNQTTKVYKIVKKINPHDLRIVKDYDITIQLLESKVDKSIIYSFINGIPTDSFLNMNQVGYENNEPYFETENKEISVNLLDLIAEAIVSGNTYKIIENKNNYKLQIKSLELEKAILEKVAIIKKNESKTAKNIPIFLVKKRSNY